MSILGLLHTSATHRERFTALLQEMASADVTWVHDVREDLLRAALDDAPESGQVRAIGAALTALRGQGAGQVLCTCSSIGRLAERAGAELGIPTLRVDRPMAERAVSLGSNILVVACLSSTLVPTAALLREVAILADRRIEIETLYLPAAWRHFEDGDEPAFARAIAGAILDSRSAVDAVVLAQASMASATELLSALPVPVLSSPGLGVTAALSRLTGARVATGKLHKSGADRVESGRL